jgi:spermidine/putrescine transport system ATP-binding protein
MTMADTIAVMNRGLIEQMGSPAQLYENPHTTFVANFLGQSNLVAGDITGRDGDNLVVHAQGAKVSIPGVRSRVNDGKVWLGHPAREDGAGRTPPTPARQQPRPRPGSLTSASSA